MIITKCFKISYFSIEHNYCFWFYLTKQTTSVLSVYYMTCQWPVPTTVRPRHMRVCQVSIPTSTPAPSPLPTPSMATQVPPSPPYDHSPVSNPTYKVLGTTSTTSTMAVTTVGGGRSRKSSARVAEPPSPVPQVDGGPTSHNKSRPTKWGPVGIGTGPSFEEWIKSRDSS